MLIRELPEEERPAMRLRRHGPTYLSESELLSILIGGERGLEHARSLLADGLLSLARSERLNDRLRATFELARRLNAIPERTADPVRDPDELARCLLARYSHHVQERMGAVYLDSKHRVIRERELYIGTLNYTAVSTRDIFRIALDLNAAALILFHNHPSGDPAPSSEDLIFTRRAMEAGRVLNIDVMDHLILGQNRFVSLRKRGAM